MEGVCGGELNKIVLSNPQKIKNLFNTCTVFHYVALSVQHIIAGEGIGKTHYFGSWVCLNVVDPWVLVCFYSSFPFLEVLVVGNSHNLDRLILELRIFFL